MELREITYWAVALRILTAVILGGAMGWERGLKNRAAGLRTYMLVCVGSCLIMLTNQYIFQTNGHAGDPVRMGAQVVSGIGFLGAGTIIVTRRHQIKGLTTAAGLWASAGVGLAIGIGFYEAAVVGVAAVLVIMTIMQKMDNNMHRSAQSLDIYFELSADSSLGDFLRQIRQQGVEICDLQKEIGADVESGTRAYTANIELQRRVPLADILKLLLTMEGVSYVEAI